MNMIVHVHVCDGHIYNVSQSIIPHCLQVDEEAR